jgi:hypothetical protein
MVANLTSWADERQRKACIALPLNKQGHARLPLASFSPVAPCVAVHSAPHVLSEILIIYIYTAHSHSRNQFRRRRRWASSWDRGGACIRSMWERERERASTRAHTGQRGGGQGCRRRWPGTEHARAGQRPRAALKKCTRAPSLKKIRNAGDQCQWVYSGGAFVRIPRDRCFM